MKHQLFYDLFDKAQKLDSLQDAHTFFETVADLYGLKHIAYTSVNIPTSIEGKACPITTFPDNWLEHYFSNGYFAVDPIIAASKASDLPTEWGQISRQNKDDMKIFNERNDFGCGNKGIVFPLLCGNTDRATFNINADMSKREWTARKVELVREIHIIAHYFHQSTIAKARVAPLARAHPLSQKELECLKWAASGKTIWETSVILSVSERTVRFHLDQARRKMNCATKIEAVAKAVASGLINIS